jgi:hypothetical protein
VQVLRPSGEVGKEITMGVFVRDIFLDQVRAGTSRQVSWTLSDIQCCDVGGLEPPYLTF